MEDRGLRKDHNENETESMYRRLKAHRRRATDRIKV